MTKPTVTELSHKLYVLREAEKSPVNSRGTLSDLSDARADFHDAYLEAQLGLNDEQRDALYDAVFGPGM